MDTFDGWMLAVATRTSYCRFMSDQARHVLDEALALPIADRAVLIAELVASMDGAPDADAEAAWATEVEARARRALSGESKGKDWAAVRAEIEGRRPRR